MSKTFTWTTDAIETLKRLKADGLSATEIQHALGAPSRNAVLGKLNRLGLCERHADKNIRKKIATRKAPPNDRATARTLDLKAKAEAARAAQAREAVAKSREAEQVSSLRAEQAVFTLAKSQSGWAERPLRGTTPIDIMSLNSRTCRWPVSTDSGLRYCGCATPAVGMTYCPSHRAASTTASSRSPEQLRLVAEMMTPGGERSAA